MMQRTQILIVLSITCGCAEPFDTPSAYEGQQYVCDNDAFDERLALCRTRWTADRSCAGITSMTGILQGQPLTVTSELSEATFLDVLVKNGAALRTEVTGIGRSPYFQFSMRYRSIGGEASNGGTTRTLTLVTNASSQVDELMDTKVAGDLRLNNGSDSSNISFKAGSLELALQNSNEEAGMFTAQFARAGDTLRGCFHYLATEHRTEDQ